MRLFLAFLLLASPATAEDVIAVRAKRLHTSAGPAIENGIVILRGGKIEAVGPASRVPAPSGARVLDAAVATPGLVDARGTVGVSGLYNSPHDQDQLDRTAPVQPELRAVDAFNPLDRLVEWVRGFGVTAIHTGHAPGELVSGQTAVLKTAGRTADEAVVKAQATVAVTLGPSGQRSGDKPPGTRGKAVAMLRQELVRAREYREKRKGADPEKAPARDLGLEAMVRVLEREVPLLVTANRAQDLAGALRLAKEFRFDLILDSAAESYLLLDAIREAKVPVLLHPPMARSWGELENASFETASKLRAAGIPFAIESGYESYVPKTRVVLFEAAIAAANGLGREDALLAITIEPAKILGVADRVGSLEAGKDADLALWDGDPFEYTTHCVATIVGGRIFEPPSPR